MAYDEHFAERLRQIFGEKNVITKEVKMMGGLGFMVDDKLCAGIFRGKLMARTDPDEKEQLSQMPGAEPMEMGGREMKGYLHVGPEGFDNDKDLEFWISKCLEFNPKAKSSKKKR